jgi:NADH:ubiquinone oxidoreductase subunit H
MWLLFLIDIIIPLLLGIMLFTLLERKLQGIIQHRIGPNVVGILQPLVDGLKLLIKDILIPQKSLLILFIISPILSFILSLSLWIVIQLIDNLFGILILLAIGSLEIYGILLGGFAAKNKYTLIGIIRTTSQLISYELILGMIYFIMALSVGSFRLYYFNLNIFYNIYIFFPLYLISIFVMLAETNRAPFDLPESESESVGGFLTEHSGIIFALYFLAEYGNMLILSYLFSLLFTTSYYLLPLHIFFFIWVRATLPRIRFDHLLKVCWYDLIPLVLSILILAYSIIFLCLF